MPNQITTTSSDQCSAIAPVNPEAKCRKRQRMARVHLDREDDDFVREAELFDIECMVLEGELGLYDQLPKRHCPVTRELSDELLTSEVATLAASVESMEKNVAKATEKISELRGLVALFLEQQRQGSSAH